MRGSTRVRTGIFFDINLVKCTPPSGHVPDSSLYLSFRVLSRILIQLPRRIENVLQRRFGRSHRARWQTQKRVGANSVQEKIHHIDDNYTRVNEEEDARCYGPGMGMRSRVANL